MADTPIKRALVSVTDKTGVVEFVKALEDEFGVEVISTGGTARVLEEAGVHVVPIEQYTGFPEMMDGRVKTLHPKVHGGLLARRDDPAHMAEAAEHGIGMIDLVCVNLYEFEKTVAKPDVTFDDAIEHIDIGGPSMLRSAAKNAVSVTVVSDPADYDEVLEQMRANDGCTTLELRRYLQLKVYDTTAAYDAAISEYLFDRYCEDFPEQVEEDVKDTDAAATPDELGLFLTKVDDLRYGENPQQTAAVYRFADDFAELGCSEHPLVGAEQVQGKPLSYNNYLDADAAWNLVREFDEPACVILKHQNPCGSAVADDVTAAYDRAFACDPKSAFGGIIACNREVPYELAEHAFDENGQFVEVIIAPSFSAEALERMAKRPNLRVLATGGAGGHAAFELRSIDGGVLLQNVDSVSEDPATFTCPTERKPTPEEMDELMFAWRVCKGVKSNAILVSKGKAGIGMGPGQPNRVDSALLACERADEACERMGVEKGGYACASDAFFPFRDNVDVLAEHGVTCIIQPGGSKRDDESIQACNEHGIAMVFTGARHFRH
ncbi:bifunctional phosphoribosylaminoimidazolecarboxamide formyltransferase/IMP cyclohydrolase [Thermophilibacter sp.]